MTKKIIAILLGVIDAVLLAVILISAVLSAIQGRGDREPSPVAVTAPTSAPTESVTETPSAAPAFPDVLSMSTAAYATLADIEGFSIAGGTGTWTQLPPDAARITDFTAVTGGWKAYMLTDPDNVRDSMVEDFFNIHISGDAAATTVTFDWYWRHFPTTDEGFDDTATPDGVFTGSWDGSGIHATGPEPVDLTGFWAVGEKEYAVGTFMWQDGVTAVIGLIRP